MTIERVKELLANATPGPWKTRAWRIETDVVSEGTCVAHVLGTTGEGNQEADNACFIAAAPDIARLAIGLSEEVERLKGGWMPWSSAPSDGTWFAACLRGGNGVDTVRMGSLGMWERLDMAEWRPFLPVHIAHVWMPLPGRPETA